MKVLIVCSLRSYAKHTSYVAPFIYEQVEALRALGVGFDYYLISGGIRGYIKSIRGIKQSIDKYSPDLVHAHFGICGLFANLQRTVPVITTFHGSDLNKVSLRPISRCAFHLSKAGILVSEKLKRFVPSSKKVNIIPCGIDTTILSVMDKMEARQKLGLDPNRKYVLFSKGFKNKAKNYPLAREAVVFYNSRVSDKEKIELLEFLGYSREQANWLFNAVDSVIMTSRNEGSPQFIKEAMACNCPIVSVDVGDVRQVISGVEGCYLTERDPRDIAEKLALATKHGRTTGRSRIIQEYDSVVIARRVYEVYNRVLNNE